MINRDNLGNALNAMGYSTKDGGTAFSKAWPETNASIAVDLSKGRIEYPINRGFVVNKATTCNFSDNENFVVLACVTKLFDKGYRPESLELEREWTLGHEQKSGRADICINDENGDTLAIIECKTPGAEFRDEWKNMRADGGQLFSYWQQERGTRWLVLFTCDLEDDEVKLEQKSITCTDDANFKALARRDDSILLYEGAHTVEGLFEAWTETYNQQVEGDVLFGDRSTAYRPMVPPLLKGDLVDFRAEDRIVNRFEEILRHNNVSDKENAFNRLVALFIAKLQDELSKMSTQEVEFQYKQGTDTYESLQDRLQRLHSEGMRKLMREDVLYVPGDYAERVVCHYTGQNRKGLIDELNGTLRKLKFYTNSDFAFKDVHNEELFLQNGKVLVEMVQLLQPYRIVGSGDVQFLGDLFEQLLNQGFKQDEGQFFTPVPIARFMWRSLPLDDIVCDEGDGVRYPRVIDYACGAGHFLTEGFEEISNAAYRYDPYFEDSLNDAEWVRGRLVGVEKDYRLARVSRVALYMHGAGQGEIVFGDGLENYPDKGIDSRKDDGRFDILVTNPPYSVAAFKPHLKLHNNDLNVLDEITDNGSEIETLFVERAAQLVRPGGYAAIVLPSSILDKGTNSSFVAARDVMLSSFEIVAIARFGSGTFAATGTNVAIMFLRRFDEVPTRDASAGDFVEAVFAGEDLSGWSDGEILASYLKLIDVKWDDYRAFVDGARPWGEWPDVPHFRSYAAVFPKTQAFKAMKKTRAYKNTDSETRARMEDEAFYRHAHAEERKRLRVFALVHGERALVVNSPTAKPEIAAFLGYKWSNRKGNEGIQLLDGGGMLYSDDPMDADEGTISDVVRSWFEGEEAEASDISQHYYYADVERFIDFDGEKFDETLKMPRTFYQQRNFAEDVEVRALGDIAVYANTSVPQTDIDGEDYVTTDNMVKGRGGIEPYAGDTPASAGTAYEKGDTLVSNIRPYLQKVWLADRDGACSKDVLVFRSKDPNVVLPEFLHLLLWQKDFFDYDMSTFTGTGRPRGDKSKILSYRVPVPPIDEQHELAEAFAVLNADIIRVAGELESIKQNVNARFNELFGVPTQEGRWRFEYLGELYNVKSSKRIYARNQVRSGIPFYRVADINQLIGNGHVTPSLFISDTSYQSLLNAGQVPKPGDILVTARGTLGNCYMVHPDDRFYFQDGMITWLAQTDHSPLSRFTLAVLTSRAYRERLEEVAVNGTTVDYLSIDSLSHVAIPIPPVELQEEFISYAAEADKKGDVMKDKLTKLESERERLLSSYLK